MKRKIKSYLIGLVLLLLLFFCFNQVFKEKVNPLLLPEDQKEILVTLKGKLILKLFPGPPEYYSIEDGDREDYCWLLQLDKTSFEIAKTTPVGEPAQDLDYIMKKSNPDEISLAIEKEMIDICNQHKGKKIVCEGYLFHAHTAHHYTPILMDVRKIRKK